MPDSDKIFAIGNKIAESIYRIIKSEVSELNTLCLHVCL